MGLILVKRSNSLRKVKQIRLPGVPWHLGSLSYSGVPMAPIQNGIGLFTDIPMVSSGIGLPVASIAAAPIRASVKLNSMSKYVSSTACRHLTAWAKTSGPIPSPPNKSDVQLHLRNTFYIRFCCSSIISWMSLSNDFLFADQHI